jgi:hypothetical protein
VATRHLGVAGSGARGATMLGMSTRIPHIRRTITSVDTSAALAGAVAAPAASAAGAGQTVKVTAGHAYVDNKAPGRFVYGTIFKGNRFRIDRVARVTHGSAKGVWYHGTGTVTGEHAETAKAGIKPFKITGWVKASAFA